MSYQRPFDFIQGFRNTNQQQYMNIGYVSSPYPDKTGQGDYGPLQGGGVYYRPENPVYPYPMDKTRPCAPPKRSKESPKEEKGCKSCL
jgi:hypothetical protein